MYDYEKCQYCGSEEVKYNPLTDEYVKCIKCGQTLRVASFEREHLRIGKQIKAREKAEEDLRQAQQEKQDAQKQLGDAVSALAGIQSVQESGLQALAELLQGQAGAKQGQQDIANLMQTLRQEGRQGQDVITRLMQAAIQNQQTGEGKLKALQGLAEDILAAQGRESTLLKVCMQRLQTGQDETTELIRQMNQESTRRLEAIVQVACALQNSVGSIDSKVEQLQHKADETRNAIDSFHAAFQQAKRNELTELYHRANNSWEDQRFDDAIDEYRDVIVKGGKDAEVYWRIVLCHYCVVYQRDDEDQIIPTLINPDLTEPDRISARRDLEHCIQGTPQEEYYHQRLRKIDWILERYRRVKDQMQYDVFISVKQSYNNHYTTDSDMASDLYDYLTGLGLRVFNSRRCKKDIPLGKDYEPYIIAALLSSRVLIVVGTKHDYMNAQWVRNEWSRFQWLMAKEEQRMGKSQRVLFCYLSKDMSPHNIPRGLSHGQAVIENGNAYAYIEQEMRKIFLLQRKEKATNQQILSDDVQNTISKLETWLTLGKYEQVTNCYQDLMSSPNAEYQRNIRLPLYALCAKQKIAFLEDLPNSVESLEEESLFRLALKRAQSNQEDTAWLKSMVEENKRNQRSTYEKSVETASPNDIQHLVQLVEAEPNNAALLTKIGDCYYNGSGVKIDYKEAVVWYQKAAALNEKNAQEKLGYCYQHGVGVKMNVREAIFWYHKAADQENYLYQLGED